MTITLSSCVSTPNCRPTTTLAGCSPPSLSSTCSRCVCLTPTAAPKLTHPNGSCLSSCSCTPKASSARPVGPSWPVTTTSPSGCCAASARAAPGCTPSATASSLSSTPGTLN